MNLRRMAWSNVWRSRQRYAAYLGSAVFSVMVFFLFNSVTLHPNFQGGYAGADTAAAAMQAGSVVVAMFTFFFLLYTNSAFIRFRQQEFGLLRLMGVARGQLARLLMWEGFIIGSAAVVIGSGLGLLFVRLFFMGIAVLMDLGEPIPFYAGPDVWLRTAGIFGTFFLIVSLHAIRGVMKKPIIELLRAHRRPKSAPEFSRWKVVLGVLLLGAGYALATFGDQEHIVLAAVPITLMVSFGTSLLVHEGSIALLVRLHRNEKRFYRPVSFLHLSQLLFKLRDNARTITSASLLVAVILTAMGTIYSVYAVTQDEVGDVYPLSFEVARPDGFGSDGFPDEAGRITAALEDHGLDVSHHWHLTTTKVGVETDGIRIEATLVPYSLYEDMRRARGGSVLPIDGPGDAIVVLANALEGIEGRAYELTVGALPRHPGGELRLDTRGRLFSQRFWASLVVADDVFADIMDGLPGDRLRTLAAWITSPETGRAALDADEHIRREHVPRILEGTDGGVFVASRAEGYRDQITMWGIILFMAAFASLVFFAACCSLLYFRLHTEIDDDRLYYRRLRDLGVGREVLRRVSRRQTFVLFFVPFTIGLIHSTFAMRSLGVVIGRSVFHYGWLMAAAYLVIYGLYYLGAEGFYRRSLGLAPAGS